MSRDIEILERLGEYIARDLGEGPSEEMLILQRRDFLAVVAGERTTRWRLVIGAAAAAAVLAVLLAAVFSTEQNRATIPFWVGGEGVHGVEGQWVRTGAAALPIHFEGGSEFTLAPNASARMVRSTKQEVRMDLASGNVHCDINRNNVTRWNVVAGPYTIMVTGTVFNAQWDPLSGNLGVDVERGSVLVSGADLREHGVRLAKGDHLSVDGARAVISISGDSDPSGAGDDESVDPSVDLPEDTTPPSLTDGDDFQNTGKHKASETKGTIGNGAKREHLPAIGASEPSPQTMSLETLWQAASKARYEKEVKKAESLLLTVRRRFPGTRQASSVPFLMGRVHLELKGNPDGALKWFRQYLHETPTGPLAEEALGRMIDACRQAGNSECAKRNAERYLGKYSNGVFDDLAKSVLGD